MCSECVLFNCSRGRGSIFFSEKSVCWDSSLQVCHYNVQNFVKYSTSETSCFIPILVFTTASIGSGAPLSGYSPVLSVQFSLVFGVKVYKWYHFGCYTVYNSWYRHTGRWREQAWWTEYASYSRLYLRTEEDLKPVPIRFLSICVVANLLLRVQVLSKRVLCKALFDLILLDLVYFKRWKRWYYWPLSNRS